MKTNGIGRLASLLLVSGLSLGLGACATEKTADPPGQTAPEKSEGEPKKGAAQIWAENCGRCHNVRSPSSYSDAQWEVIGHHMRVRGYLTGEEQRTIVEFLKAGN